MPPDEGPEVIGKLQDLRASREPLTPEEAECAALCEQVKKGCAKGEAYQTAILKGLSEATGMSALLVGPLSSFTDAERQRAIDTLSRALQCGVLLYDAKLGPLVMEAMRQVKARLQGPSPMEH